MAYDKKVQSIYEKTFKVKKLAPAHVRKLKEAMLVAAKKNKGDSRAIRAAGRAFVKELKGGKKSTTSKKKGKAKKDTTPAAKAKELSVAEKAVYESRAYTSDGKIDLRRLTRKSLVGIAKQFGLKTLKSHSEDDIRARIAAKLTEAPKDLDKLWKQIEPTKLTDCIGVFVDLTNVSCVTCPAQADCLVKFKANVADNFERVAKKAPRQKESLGMTPVDSAPPPKPDAPETNKKKTNKKKTNKKKTNKYTRKYATDSPITVYECELPAKDNDYYRLVKRILRVVPETVGALRKLILRHFAPEEDTARARNMLVDSVIDELISIELVELAN